MADWAAMILRIGEEGGYWPAGRELVTTEARFRPGASEVMALRVGYDKLHSRDRLEADDLLGGGRSGGRSRGTPPTGRAGSAGSTGGERHAMRVLVTGGAGFLGSFLVERLEARGDEVVVPRRADYDLTRWDDAERLFATARPELVFHLAAEVGGIGANRANPGRYWFSNLIMGAHVLELSRLYERLEAGRRRHRLRLPEVHADAVLRGRPLERVPRGDERALRGGEEVDPGRRAGLPRAVRAGRDLPAAGEPRTGRATTSTSRARTSSRR